MQISEDQKSNWMNKLLKSSHVGILVVNKDRKILFVNEHLCKMFGYSSDELLGDSANIIHINNEIFNKITFKKVLAGGSVDFDYQFKKKDGTLIWAHISGDLVDPQEEVIWTITDITEKKEAEKKVEDTNYNLQQYIDALNKVDIGLAIINDDFHIQYLNSTMKQWFGDQTNNLCYLVFSEEKQPCKACKFDLNKDAFSYEAVLGENYFNIVSTTINDADGSVKMLKVVRNITERKLAQEQLESQKDALDYQAHHDNLTKLPNRTLFNKSLKLSIKRAKHNNENIALFFIDLDGFKEVNDTLGHDIGDEVLKAVARRLKNGVRKDDLVARLGGDEFTIIIKKLDDNGNCAKLARKILESINDPIIINYQEINISCSIGISYFPDTSANAHELLKNADSAMYQAKNNGKNNFQFYLT